MPAPTPAFSAKTATPLPASDDSVPRYRVFLSYSHTDTKWARWLMRRLEGYRVSTRFHGRMAPIGRVAARIAPVFRDRDELPTTSDLGEAVRTALRTSATLVVLCSPASARSRWVQEEILAFKRAHGEHRVFAFIVGGEPKVESAADDCFPPALRREIGADGALSATPAEVVAADARAQGDGPKLAFVRLVAGLLGVGFDELRQREQARRLRRMTLVAAGAGAGMAVTLSLAIVAWRARNDAQRRQDLAEDVFAFMLDDFRPELRKAGSLDLLAKVGDKAMAYFDTANPRDLTDTALARQAKALTQIGEVRMEQKDARYADAGRAFFRAYECAAALAARHPGDGDMLFERAQAEYWIGFVHWRRGDLAPANEWLGRYRDSALALLALAPGNVKWRREVISSHHNLAVLDAERGDLAAARAGFLAESDAIRHLVEADPKNLSLRFRLTDVDSYLASIAERAGDFTETRARFASQRAGLEALVAAEPTTSQWSFKLAEALQYEAGVQAVTGDLVAAAASAARGQEIINRLLQRDPTNRRWLAVRSVARLRQAAMAIAGDAKRAEPLLAEERGQLEKFAAAETQDRAAVTRLILAWRLTARLRLEAGQGDAAEAATRALALAEPLLADGRASDRTLSDIALASVVAGQTAPAADATAHWRKALEVLGPRVAQTNDWCLLDPAARALALLGRADESRVLIERVTRLGYVPLEPWPDPSHPVSVRNHNQP